MPDIFVISFYNASKERNDQFIGNHTVEIAQKF